ncbi:SagB/ThcOx family dehydrogenase [Rhizobium sp. RAF56]|uniref:SagB/ThcOx family dehydrogenase n=1 Tax=Rhizobium sp. RAF56 TaxID=3233062 RepID=UPI003F9D5EA0
MTQVDRGAPRRKLQLAEGARIEFGSVAEDPVTIYWQVWAYPLGVLTPALREAARSLADGVDEEDVASDVRQREGMRALARWSLLVQKFLDDGSLSCTLLSAAGDPLATISALAPGPTILLTQFRSSDVVALSRFAWLRVMHGVTVLESPLGRARIQLHDPRLAAAVAGLALPRTVDQLAASTGLTAETAAAFLGLLRGACALAVPSQTDVDAEASGLPLWEVQDAMFHVHSRLGRRDLAYGATCRFRGRITAPPAVAPVEGRIVPLPVPDLARCAATDRSFTAVLEARRSQRTFGPEPIHTAVLSEFLYRSARDTRLPPHPIGSGAEELTPIKRPYPGAGGCHPLEVYVVAHRCGDLERGLYRYEPASHGLVALAADPSRLDQLLAGARSAAGVVESPPVLIVVAARFARSLWKYEGIGYANLLKDAGGLLQTMCLVATAMGLAPCAIGGGDAECFAAAAGTAFWEESSVAEFILGYAVGEAS